MTGPRILVLGATGKVGGALLEKLLRLGQPVRAATRAPQRMSARPGLEVVRFDLEQPATFPAALEGVDRVFLIARPGDDQPERLARPLLEAMLRTGIRRVVDLTAMGVERQPDFGLRKLELDLEASGLAFTHLRPNWFMQVFSAGSMRASIVEDGAIRLPAADARLSFVEVGDVAECAAQALIDPRHAGQAYTLTGGQALDHTEVAQAISEAIGRPVRYLPLGEEQARQALRGAGFPEPWVERLIGFYRLVRQGLCAPVSPDVANLLGRPPTRFQEFAQASRAAFLG